MIKVCATPKVAQTKHGLDSNQQAPCTETEACTELATRACRKGDSRVFSGQASNNDKDFWPLHAVSLGHSPYAQHQSQGDGRMAAHAPQPS